MTSLPMTSLPMTSLRLAAAALLSVAALATSAPLAFAKPPSAKAIAEWLPLLPTEVFDNTTEGIEAEELDILRKKGSSENWKARRVSTTKYLATAKRPFSEVHITLRQRGTVNFLEVMTYNEKAVNYSYWQPAGEGEPLKAYQPGLTYRALNETGDARPRPAENKVPDEIRQHLVRLEACLGIKEGLKGEIPAGRRQQLTEDAKARQCDSTKPGTDALRARYSGKAPWPAVLERASRIIGE